LAPRLPARIRLYARAPEGAGTPQVESLTSYITRLAAAHCWPTRTLMEREIGPRLGWTSSLTTLLKNGAYCLNGAGHAAAKGVDALEDLTGQSGLVGLTLLPWRAVFAQRALIRAQRAWCPQCFDAWRQRDTPIYEPLIWAVAAVSACAYHRRRLCTQCPRCGAQGQPVIGSWAQPGRCSSCGTWLGSASKSAESCEEEFWTTEAVGDMLATAGRELLPHNVLVAALVRRIDEYTRGNIAAFATLIQRPRNTVWLWCNGQILPSLPTVLQLCRQLGLTPRQFLVAADHLAKTEAPTGHLRRAYTPVTRKAPVAFDRQGVRALLEQIRHDQNATPSMRHVARQVGYDRSVLYHQFPALCRQIAARARAAAAQRGAQRIRLLCQRVENVVFTLQSEGVKPTRRAVEARLATPGILRDPAVRGALVAALARCNEAMKE
jgi:hypothetical protein